MNIISINYHKFDRNDNFFKPLNKLQIFQDTFFEERGLERENCVISRLLTVDTHDSAHYIQLCAVLYTLHNTVYTIDIIEFYFGTLVTSFR